MRFRVKQQVLILIAAGVLITAYALLRYLPMRRIAGELRSEKMAQNVLITTSQARLAEMPKLQKQLDELKESLADFDSRIPFDTQLGQFLGGIAALMDKYGLTEQQIAPHEGINAEPLVCTAVTMKCRGTLEQIRRFCRSLQELDRAVRIEKFHLVNDPEYTGQLRMEAETVIYHRLPQGKS
jgi:Tfp pilus assembly protein PilO